MPRLAIALFIALLSFIGNAHATPQYTAARQAAKKILRDEQLLARRIAALSKADKAKLKAALRSVDSDSDGSPDLIENALGSNSCDSDTDDDGLDDGDDFWEDNSDGDDDGHPDDEEVEAKGLITSFAGGVVTVGGQSFTVTSQTEFGSGLGEGDLEAGLCIKVEGHSAGGGFVADSIEGCRRRGGNGGGGGSDD